MNYAIIAAAGESKKFGTKTNKLLLRILNKPVLYYTIAQFYDHPLVNRIIIVVNKKIRKEIEEMIKENFPGNSKNIKIIIGGKKRAESMIAGIEYIEKNCRVKPSDLLIIHNGANPLVSYKEIENCVKKALQKAGKEYFKMTDEASLVEKAGFHVSHIAASDHNFKITTQADFERARHILGDVPEDYIFGIGQDSHTFSKKKGLVLGGLKFEKEYKLEADSDGDVLLHALCNAVLQAIGEKSMGAFADDLCRIKKVRDSKKYLKTVLLKAKKKGYKLNHLGFMIECKQPKAGDISQKLKNNIGLLSGLNANRIGITSVSDEKLTPYGKGKGIQCFCVASLKSRKT